MNVLNDLVVPGVVTGSLYGMVALGFNTVERSTKMLNFAHGDLVMWSAMATLVAHRLWGWSAVPSLLVGIAAPLVFALVIERVAMRGFLGHQNWNWILSTLGIGMILQQFAAEQFDSQPQAFPFSLNRDPRNIGPIQISDQSLLMIGLLIVSAIAVHMVYSKTRLGKKLLAAGEDPDGARALGIAPGRMLQVAMLQSAVIAAATGLVVAPLVLVYPGFGFALSFVGFVAASIGGLGSIGGSVLGGLVAGLLVQFAVVEWGALWSNTVLFGALLALYLVRPWGVFGHAPVRSV